jgi:hypothetical protein
MVLSQGLLAGQAHLLPLTISPIEATIDLTPELGRFNLSGKSPLFNFVELSGIFTPADLGFKLDYELNDLKFHNLFPALGDKRLLPVESAISLRGGISGNGAGQFAASLAGDFPCFVAHSGTESFLLDCGKADLDITKNDNGLTININELQLKNPRMVLSGKIARFTGKGAEEKAEPVWLLDLAGKDLDLTAIRKGVLTLWGDNHIAKTVCAIVLGGKAGNATYYFKAPLSGFKSIQQMKINVDVEEAEIHPPSTPLFLEKARGRIEISDGYLSGQGLTARLGDSTADNCSLLLDLASRKEEFKLDLDIDADLAALPAVLYDLVHHHGFRRELKRFANVQGRAVGHLSIGDSLNDPRVAVNIGSIYGGAEYEPLPHPFTIRSGKLDISPSSIRWQGIRGIIGPHMIRETTGNVAWDKDIFLAIESAQATFDSAMLLDDLRATSMLPDKIAQTIVKAEGSIELNKGTMSGPISNPDDWQYSLDIATSGSRWTSPLLPREILAERLKARIGPEQIDLLSGKIWLYEQPLLVEGSFHHKNFSNWQALSILSGTIREPMAQWIRKKGWIPNKYFPVIPCTLDKMKAQWNSESLKLSGAIAAGMGGIASPSVRLQLESDRNHLKINELVISSPAEQGRLTLEYLKTEPPRLNASWQGFINSDTVLKLLNTNILQAERLEGDFSIKHVVQPAGNYLNGWCKIHNMDWFFNTVNHDLKIRDLKITGEQDGSIMISQAVITNREEELELNGQLTLGPDNISFDLGLTADKIDRRTAEQISNDIKGFAAINDDTLPPPPSPATEKKLAGVLYFKTGLFTSSPGGDQKEKGAFSHFTLSPANGFLTIDSATDRYSLDLRNSNICDLNISGTLNPETSPHESSLTIFTDSSSPPLFKDVLPCFGLNNTLIDGNIYLDVNLKGNANIWQSGNAALYSDGGYIHRLGFLSKVFRIINLRDIFSGVDMPDFDNKGFAYSKVDITSHVEDNTFYIDKVFVDGEGLNIFGQGTIDLSDWSVDLTIMLAPLKTMDAILTSIPILGKVVGGTDKAVISIPVSLKGSLIDPTVTLLPAEAIGEGLRNLVANTLMMPFQILSPLLSGPEQ